MKRYQKLSSRVRLKVGGMITLVALLAVSTAVVAEEIQDLAPTKLIGSKVEQSKLSSLKTGTPAIDVPQSLSMVQAARIKEQGFKSVADIIDYTPGVNTSQGEGHRDAVVFRGVRSTADFFVDGFRDDVQYYRPLYNVEQVEILRGPNALFFGRGGAGGVINRVMKKAVIGDDFTTYQASVDTFGERSVQFDTNYTASDKVSLRLNATHSRLANHRDFYDGRNMGFNPSARLKLGPKTTLDVSYEYMNHDRFIDRGIPTGADGRPMEAFKSIVFGDGDQNQSEFEAHVIRAMVDHRFDEDWRSRLAVSYGDYDKLYRNFYVSGFDQANTPNVVTLDGYVDTTQRKRVTFSGDLLGEFESGNIEHTVVTGFETHLTANDNDRFNAFWNTTADDNEIFAIQRPLNLRSGVGINSSGLSTSNDFASDLNDDSHADIAVFSAFIQDEIKLMDELNLILGARFDRFEIDVDNIVGNTQRSRTDEKISPRVGLVFKATEKSSLYASYSQSFLPASGEQFAGINGNANRLDPDTFTNYEAGLKWDFKKGLSLTAALFKIETKAPEISASNPNVSVDVESETRGFELQLEGEIIDRWRITAGYGFLDGEIETQTGGGNAGKRPRELPEHMFSLWNYLSINSKLGAGLGVIYQDESFIDNANTKRLPSYARVDAALYYQLSEKLRFQVNIENLTDEVYFPNAHANHQVSVGAPINALFSISGAF